MVCRGNIDLDRTGIGFVNTLLKIIAKGYKNVLCPFLYKSLQTRNRYTKKIRLHSQYIQRMVRCNSNFLFILFFDCCKQSLTRLYHPPIHPSNHPSTHPSTHPSQKRSDWQFTVEICSYFVQITRQVRNSFFSKLLFSF